MDSQYPKLTKDLFSILNNLKTDKKFKIDNHFDIDKWAKYFAIIDLTGAYHGSLAKVLNFFTILQLHLNQLDMISTKEQEYLIILY